MEEAYRAWLRWTVGGGGHADDLRAHRAGIPAMLCRRSLLTFFLFSACSVHACPAESPGNKMGTRQNSVQCTLICDGILFAQRTLCARIFGKSPGDKMGAYKLPV